MYRLDGKEVEERDKDALALVRSRKIGFVFQGYNLLPRMSAIENVELPMMYDAVPGKRTGRRGAGSTGILGILDREDHIPSQLSGGQQQRVAIARAVVNSPSLILADEPTGNLDTVASDDIMGIFRRLNDEAGDHDRGRDTRAGYRAVRQADSPVPGRTDRVRRGCARSERRRRGR